MAPSAHAKMIQWEINSEFAALSHEWILPTPFPRLFYLMAVIEILTSESLWQV